MHLWVQPNTKLSYCYCARTDRDKMEETSSHASPATLPQGLEKCSSGGWKQKLEKSRMEEERERKRDRATKAAKRVRYMREVNLLHTCSFHFMQATSEHQLIVWSESHLVRGTTY